MSRKPSLIEQLAFPTDTDSSFEASGIEYEVEVYLKGFDIEQIKSMASSHEGQEQWGIYVPKVAANASSGSLRVRETMDVDGNVEYVSATKTDAGAQGKLEHQLITDRVQFDQYKLMADQGLIKTRYNIPGELVDGTKLTWEVDAFYNKRGELVPWLKIDAEFEDILPNGMNPQDIPFTYDEIIIITPEDKAKGRSEVTDKIAKLYEEFFRTENVFV